MKARKRLTGRQAAFARAYAITGNGVRSAKLAGYRDGSGLATTAWRLKNDAEICREVERLRNSEMVNLRREISRSIIQPIDAVLSTGGGCRKAQKALRLARRIGLFDWERELRSIASNIARDLGPLERSDGEAP